MSSALPPLLQKKQQQQQDDDGVKSDTKQQPRHFLCRHSWWKKPRASDDKDGIAKDSVGAAEPNHKADSLPSTCPNRRHNVEKYPHFNTLIRQTQFVVERPHRRQGESGIKLVCCTWRSDWTGTERNGMAREEWNERTNRRNEMCVARLRTFYQENMCLFVGELFASPSSGEPNTSFKC